MDVTPKSSAAKLNKDLKATPKKLKGACITDINDAPVHSKQDVTKAITIAQEQRGRLDTKFGIARPQLSMIVGVDACVGC